MRDKGVLLRPPNLSAALRTVTAARWSAMTIYGRSRPSGTQTPIKSSSGERLLWTDKAGKRGALVLRSVSNAWRSVERNRVAEGNTFDVAARPRRDARRSVDVVVRS